MPGPVEVFVPAQSEWGRVARNVVLSFATVCGVEAHQLDELGIVCGQVWEEIAHSPGVTDVSVRVGWSDDLIHLEVEGRSPEHTQSEEGSGWSSSLTRVVVGRLTRTATLHRTNDTVRIEADFPAARTGRSSF